VNRLIAVLCILAPFAPAQFFPFGRGLSRPLIDHLELATGQVDAINRANSEHDRWTQEKSARINQVYRELAAETDKEPLDPKALGIRYAEIEGICREIADRGKALTREHAALLNESQKAKLKALEEAVSLASKIVTASAHGLMEVLPGGNGELITAVLVPANACPPRAQVGFANTTP